MKTLFLIIVSFLLVGCTSTKYISKQKCANMIVIQEKILKNNQCISYLMGHCDGIMGERTNEHWFL